MIRENGTMLVKLRNEKGQDGFRTETWRDPYEYAAEEIFKKHEWSKQRSRGREMQSDDHNG